MVKIYETQCAIWDRIHFYISPDNDYQVKDFVVVKNEQNLDIVKVVGLRLTKKEALDTENAEVSPILRKATADEVEKMHLRLEKRHQDIDLCEGFIQKLKLSMKIVDVYYSLDGGKITFAFTADGRVDFRELVRSLTSHFHKSIRLQQLGVRDAARSLGDIGICGIKQCCKTHLKGLNNITTEMAEYQHIAHRGSERLSGACGRLKCCLAYELELYKEYNKRMPPIGSKAKTKEGIKGIVVAWRVLKGAVDIKVPETGKIFEVQLKDLKILSNSK